MNDDIKKFIDLTNLYTEVEINKSEKLDESFLDWIKNKLNPDEEQEGSLNNLDPKVVDELDDVVDKIDTTVTTQAQANSILQNPDATDAQRKAAQDFYDENSDPESTGPADTAPEVTTDTAPEVTTDQQANIILGDRNATEAERKAAQDYYANKNGGADAVDAVDAGAETPGAEAGADDAVDAGAETPGAEAEVTGSGRGDGNAEVAQRRRDDTTADTTATTADPEEVEPAADADAAASTQAPGNATDDGGLGQRPAPAAQEPAASNGSLLGRKLDLTTPNIMKAYNDGGKQAMPTIKNMQTALSRLGFDPNGLDGKYGNGTFKAVQEFQKANGLAVDGQAGPSTMAAIKKALDDNFDANKVTPADSAQAAAPTVQTASKDNNMNKNKINEASMNISMNGNDASEVADLVKLLQNAGMPQASPVSDMPMQMPRSSPIIGNDHDSHDSHDNMKSMMTLMSEPEDTPCGEDCGCDSCATEDTSEYDAVVSEWDNSPEEEYSDVSAVIPDGDDLHKSKKPYPAVDGGDNAMALESIKETLWAALQEKTTVEGRGRGKKMKLKASRGNEDIKTTEGSRGKKSRGKKSRG